MSHFAQVVLVTMIGGAAGGLVVLVGAAILGWLQERRWEHERQERRSREILDRQGPER
jgi:hypothetical protein